MTIQGIQELDKTDTTTSENETMNVTNKAQKQGSDTAELKLSFISPKQNITKLNSVNNDNVPVYIIHCQGLYQTATVFTVICCVVLFI